MKPWKIILLAFSAGMAGMIVALALWVAYVDHQRVTAMWQVMTRPPQQGAPTPVVAPTVEKK